MTNQSELDKRLEDILRHIDDEKADGHWITADTAKDKIKQLIADEVEKLIGEDEDFDTATHGYGVMYDSARNDLREDLRTKLAEWLGEESV